MTDAARRLRDTYAIRPGAPLYRSEELGWFSLDRWREQGMPGGVSREELFSLHTGGYFYLIRKGFDPPFEVTLLQDLGDYELVQDESGRHVLYFKGRRNGFMPEYRSFPVVDRASWEEKVKWRLDPSSPARYGGLPALIDKAREAGSAGAMMRAYCGGYAFLRNMVGTLGTLYAVYDMPDVIHEIMRAWLAVTDAALERYQRHLSLDELFFGEDICYKTGPMMSESMFREFLLPYYQQLVSDVRRRQEGRGVTLHVQVDSDGLVDRVIPWYRDMGMDVMSPFEVAAGNDILEVARRWPDLVLWGAIDGMLERILPPLRARGGYVPCCDHGLPEEVPYADYLYYRRRCVEIGG